MQENIVILFLITLIPGLELRASIPMGVFGGEYIGEPMPWPMVVAICVVSNIIIGWAVFFLLDPLMKMLRKCALLDKFAHKYLDRAQRKLHPQVEKYGFWGVSIFIGIPLPMTGAYTGAAGAYALGMKKKDFMLANVAGVLIAATCVTAICLLIQAGIDSPLLKMFIK